MLKKTRFTKKEEHELKRLLLRSIADDEKARRELDRKAAQASATVDIAKSMRKVALEVSKVIDKQEEQNKITQRVAAKQREQLADDEEAMQLIMLNIL